MTGPIPTMIERDGNLPSFDELLVERERAHGHLREATLLPPTNCCGRTRRQ